MNGLNCYETESFPPKLLSIKTQHIGMLGNNRKVSLSLSHSAGNPSDADAGLDQTINDNSIHLFQHHQKAKR